MFLELETFWMSSSCLTFWLPEVLLLVSAAHLASCNMSQLVVYVLMDAFKFP